MNEFIAQHQFWVAVGIYWIFSAGVSSMSAPAVNSRPGYIWVYRFMHSLAGNVTTVFGSRIPGAALGVLLMIPPFFSVAACTPHYVVHPGALNLTDSAAYDALLIAETTIDQARAAYTAGELPASAKAPLNALIQAYNVAHESWLAYRGAIATKSPPEVYFDQLTANINDLTNAIRALKEAPMKTKIIFEIARLAMAIIDSQATSTLQKSAAIADLLTQIVQKGLLAYEQYMGKPLDPSLIHAEALV